MPMAIFLLWFVSCKKDNSTITLTSSVMVVNAAVNVPAIQVNVTGNPIKYAGGVSIPYGSGGFYFLSRKAMPVTVVSAADTTTFLFNNTLNFQSGIYTMYLIGQAPTIDTLFREETNFPFIHTDLSTPPSSDSVVNVRFVNLSPNSVPLKIKITGATTNEVDNLPYKGISNWKRYNTLVATTVYSFQIRDAATDALITTYSFSATATNRFKNVALIIKGLQGTTTGSNAFGVSAVNYF